MNVQSLRADADEWVCDQPPLEHAALVIYFGAPTKLADGRLIEQLRARYPGARLVGCSTGGEILAEEALDDTVVAVAVQFAATTIQTASRTITTPADSEQVGQELGHALAGDGLRCVFVLADGIRINGSALIRGLRSELSAEVVITGGMAGDGARFQTTLVGLDSAPVEGNIVAVGFFGSSIRVSHGSVGGWESFGPRRTITRANGNVLYEIDGEPALALYKRYLGDGAAGLPGTALSFPLRISRDGRLDVDLVRTVLAVDEASQSMTFAGDMPEGATVQLMRGSLGRLVAGASEAARRAAADGPPSLAILVSCIGRKLLMGQRIGDEVEAASEAFAPSTVTLGFYSYGEFSPHVATGVCELHNQTMTVTALSEA